MLFVSVIMPACEAERYIRSAVESVIAQTYPLWELIVVDDNSQDGTYASVCQIIAREKRIVLLKNEKNLGSAGARNRALGVARGDLIAFLDADDMWDPSFLEKQVSFLETHDCFGVTSGYRRLYKDNITNFVPPKRIEARSILGGNAISCLSTVFKRPDPKLYFDLELRKCEDLLYWYRVLSEHGPFLGNDEILATYRIRDDSKSRDKTKLIKWQWAVYRKCGFSASKSLRYLFSWAIYGLRKYKNVFSSKNKRAKY